MNESPTILTFQGKKKSAVFHNIVEVLEILLDKASSSSGASTMRDFQSLTRCLTDVDHAALTSNSFEFLKVLIEEEINLDSVSSILQMLIRMNKSFENFVSGKVALIPHGTIGETDPSSDFCVFHDSKSKPFFVLYLLFVGAFLVKRARILQWLVFFRQTTISL